MPDPTEEIAAIVASRGEPERYSDDLPSAAPEPAATADEREHVSMPQPAAQDTPDGQTPTDFASLTTMQVGGKFAQLLVARTAFELAAHAAGLWESEDPWLLLGGGSNTIVADSGYPGSVLLVRNTGIAVVADDNLPENKVRVRVQAGQDWDELVAWSVAQGYAGIEMLSGIPGLAGAAPVQNIGAYGGELANTLHSVELYERDLAAVRRLPAAELRLAYRDSILKQGYEAVVLSIDLVLDASRENTTAEGQPLSAPIIFPQLAKALGVKLGAQVPLREVRDTVLRVRAEKGMVLDPQDPNSVSAGSFFMNPIVSEQFARTLPSHAPRFPVDAEEASDTVTTFDAIRDGQLPPLPDYESGERRVKLSAAWLIENAGIKKGFRLPGSKAAISDKHTLAITNRGGATAAEIGELARYVVSMVQAEFGVVLAPEPNIYGIEI